MKTMKWLALTAAVLLCLTGCSVDVESFLQPPAVGGEQQAVQTALETYLRDTVGNQRYVIKYPVEGDHTAAFLLCDDRGFPVEEGENPSLALAFYSLTAAPEETRMNLLYRQGEDWVSVADTAGVGADIRQVAFGDLDADGTAELVTGWTTYNNLSHRLAVYAVASGLTLLCDDQYYTAMYVGELMADGGDSLMLFTIAGGERVEAALCRLQQSHLTMDERVSLDGGITRFGNMTLCRLADGVHGLFVEATRSDGSVVTELIYRDSQGLCAPFYDTATNTSPVTRRNHPLAARDVDGDAMVEIPHHVLLEGHTESDLCGGVVHWRRWDYDGRRWQEVTATLVNAADGYMITLSDTEGINTAYDDATRTLTLTRNGKPYLYLTVGEKIPAPDEEWESMTLFREDDNARHSVWYDPTAVTAERIRYTITRWNGMGG